MMMDDASNERIARSSVNMHSTRTDATHHATYAMYAYCVATYRRASNAPICLLACMLTYLLGR